MNLEIEFIESPRRFLEKLANGGLNVSLFLRAPPNHPSIPALDERVIKAVAVKKTRIRKLRIRKL